MAVKLLYKVLLWQSYPWSWKSWLSWRTRRSNVPCVSWGSMGTHQSWMSFMTRYPRITWRALFSLRAFFTFDARLSLEERKIISPPQNKRQTSDFQAQQNMNSWAGKVTEYNIWCITNDPQIITDREWLKRELGEWEAWQTSTFHALLFNDPFLQPLTQNSLLYFSVWNS